MSLRGRLLVLLLALVALGLVASDVVTYTVLHRFLLQRVDQQLNGARGIELAVVEFPARLRNQADTLGNRMDAYIQVRDPAGRIIRSIASGREASPPRIPRRLPAAGTDPIVP